MNVCMYAGVHVNVCMYACIPSIVVDTRCLEYVYMSIKYVSKP